MIVTAITTTRNNEASEKGHMDLRYLGTEAVDRADSTVARPTVHVDCRMRKIIF